MTTRPSTYRKMTGSFVSDASVGQLMQQQQSPRPDMSSYERCTSASHNSKTNFIGDAILSEGPRAVVISHTGEKHMLPIEECELMNAPMNPFAATVTPSTLIVPKTSDSLINIPNLSIERSRHSNTKRTKSSRRYINQKPRPVFTPRNIEKYTPRTPSEHEAKHSQNFHAQTQTDVHTQHTQHVQHGQHAQHTQHTQHSHQNQSQSRAHSQSTHPTKHTTPSSPPSIPTPAPVKSHVYHLSPTPAVALPRRYIRETVGDRLAAESPSAAAHRQPLRLLPTDKKSKVKDYSELRSIASALTLLTVVSWLFSTFFELEGIVDLLSGILRSIQALFTRKEQTKTKAEALVQFVRNLWS